MFFFNWKYVLGGGINKIICVNNYQCLVKLWVFFKIPWTKALWHGFTKWRPRGDPILPGSEVISSLKLFIKLGMMRHLNWEPQMEIQNILDLTGSRCQIWILSWNPAELVQEKIRVFLFWSSVQPNNLKSIPNFNFGEEINPGLGSLKNSSFVKSPNFRQ